MGPRWIMLFGLVMRELLWSLEMVFTTWFVQFINYFLFPFNSNHQTWSLLVMILSSLSLDCQITSDCLSGNYFWQNNLTLYSNTGRERGGERYCWEFLSAEDSINIGHLPLSTMSTKLRVHWDYKLIFIFPGYVIQNQHLSSKGAIF